jgi:hypothetical protein
MPTREELEKLLESIATVPCELTIFNTDGGEVYIDDLSTSPPTCYRYRFYPDEEDFVEFTTKEQDEWSGDWDSIQMADIPSWVREAFQRVGTAFCMLV